MMKKAQNGVSIILVENTGVQIFCLKNPQGVQFPFSQGAVQHMEIVSHDALQPLLDQATATLELADTQAFFVFGQSMVFEKQLPQLPEDKIQTELEQFRIATPFERVASHVYKNPQGSHLVSMNRDFYDTLRQIFERNSVHIIGVLPYFNLQSVIGNVPIQAKTLITLNGKVEDISEQSIIVHKSQPKTLQEKQEYISKQYSGVVIAVFILFIVGVIGLTGFILRSQFQASRKPLATPIPVVEPTPSVVPEASAEVQETPVASTSAVRITITHAPEAASQAASLVRLLRAASYTQISSQSQQGLQSTQPLVVFQPNLSVQYRTQIQDALKQIFPTLSVQELSEIPTEVAITIGK